jgi:hypothetical protein
VTLPNPLPRPPGELEALERAWQAPRGWRLLSSVNNTHVGLFYIATSLLFFLAAGVLALLMRAQLAVPGNTLLTEATYNQVFTMHGTVMMFLFAVPVVEAIGLPAAGHAGRARPALPSPVGVCVLGVRGGRRGVLHDDFLRCGPRRRLVHVPAAD